VEFVCSRELVGQASAGSNRAELKAAIGSFVAPLPDLTADVRYLVQEDDLVSSWVSFMAIREAGSAGVRLAAGA